MSDPNRLVNGLPVHGWAAGVGVTCQAQYAHSLLPPLSWLPVDSPVTCTGLLMQLPDTSAGAVASRLYRVLLSPP